MGFCGRTIKCTITFAGIPHLVDPATFIFLAEVHPTGVNRFSLNSCHSKEHIFNHMKVAKSQGGDFIVGLVIGRRECNGKMVLEVEFNKQLHSWDYSWKSNRWSGPSETHIVEVAVLRDQGSSLQVIGSVNSPHFRIVSNKKTRKEERATTPSAASSAPAPALEHSVSSESLCRPIQSPVSAEKSKGTKQDRTNSFPDFEYGKLTKSRVVSPEGMTGFEWMGELAAKVPGLLPADAQASSYSSREESLQTQTQTQPQTQTQKASAFEEENDSGEPGPGPGPFMYGNGKFGVVSPSSSSSSGMAWFPAPITRMPMPMALPAMGNAKDFIVASKHQQQKSESAAAGPRTDKSKMTSEETNEIDCELEASSRVLASFRSISTAGNAEKAMKNCAKGESAAVVGILDPASFAYNSELCMPRKGILETEEVTSEISARPLRLQFTASDSERSSSSSTGFTSRESSDSCDLTVHASTEDLSKKDMPASKRRR
jgi:hypothetical protein